MMVFLLGCSGSYKEQALSIGSFGLSPKDTLELRPQVPLVCREDTCAILLDVKSNYKWVNGEVLVNGTPLELRIYLAAPDGRKQRLEWHGSWGRSLFFVLVQSASSGGFSAVQISSNLPIVVSDIKWVNFSAAEVKR